MEMIRFENVSFVYPNGFCAVKDLSFSVQQGENIAVVGQNGAGKSTAAKLVNGLEPFPGKRTRKYPKNRNESLIFCGMLVHAA